MKHTGVGIILLLIICSCGGSRGAAGDEPGAGSFRYYDREFRLTVRAINPLRVDGAYYSYGRDSILSILKFYEDGFLNAFATVNTNRIACPPCLLCSRKETGAMKGYYTLVNDSVYFSTKSFYQHSEVLYSGQIIGDRLNLAVRHPKKEPVRMEYVFCRE